MLAFDPDGEMIGVDADHSAPGMEQGRNFLFDGGSNHRFPQPIWSA
jgi:hypothetical protein